MEGNWIPVGLDMDSVIEMVGNPNGGSFQGAYSDGWHLHIHPGPDGGGSAVRNLDGTVEIPLALPTVGTNTCLGMYSDLGTNSVVGFVHNPDTDGGDHIFWHRPIEGITGVFPAPLNLDPAFPVSGCVLIAKELLVFTDNNNYPKCLNLPRAFEDGKKGIVRVYLPQAQGIVTQRTFTGQLVFEGTPFGSAYILAFTATPREVRDFSPMMDKLADAWNATGPLASQFTAKGMADHVELTSATTGIWSVKITAIDSFASGQPIQTVCIAEFWNRYNGPVGNGRIILTERQIRLERVVPTFPPLVSLAADDTVKTNCIENAMWQFAVRYVFKDIDRSVIGPFSTIALPPTSVCGAASSSYNRVDVDFSNDPMLDDPDMRGEITAVEIHARNAPTDAWSKAATLGKSEWMYQRVFKFYNDVAYQPTGDTDANTTATSIPDKAEGIAVAIDSDSATRIVLANCTEGDANPGVAITVKPVLSDSTISATCAVVGKIRIVALFENGQIGMNQPIGTLDGQSASFGGIGPNYHVGSPNLCDQMIPLGGWVPFIAGTDLYDISKQNIPSVVLSGGTLTQNLWTPPTGNPASGRNVFDLSKTGFAVNDWNKSGRSAYRELMDHNQEVYSTFRIDGLVAGQTYIVRVASHNLSFDNADPLYDLSNPSLEWQGSPSRTIKVGTVASSIVEPGQCECVITIPATMGGQDIDIGEIWMADCTKADLVQQNTGTTALAHGYAYNTNGVGATVAPSTGRTPGTAELQLVAFGNYSGSGYSSSWGYTIATGDAALDTKINTGLSFSDHNGYFWFAQKGTNGGGGGWRAAWLSNSGSPGGTIASWGGTTISVSNFAILNDLNSQKYYLQSGTVQSLPLSKIIDVPGATFYYIPTDLPVVSGTQTKPRQCFTRIRARMLSQSGLPVKGIVAVLERGRVAISDNDGTIDIVAFSDMLENQNRRMQDRLVLLGSGICPVTFSIVNPADILVTQFVVDSQWCDDVWYDLGDITATVGGMSRRNTFLRGGHVMAGVRFLRDTGKCTPVLPVAKVRIPPTGQNLVEYDGIEYPASTYPNGLWRTGAASLLFEILGDVPIPESGRFVKMEICMTDELSCGDSTGTGFAYLQWRASQVVYAVTSTVVSSNSVPTPVDPLTTSPTEIWINLGDSFTQYGKTNTQADVPLGYDWQSGDMIRFVAAADGAFYQKVYEARVKAQRGDWIILDASTSLPNLVGGELIDLYRPQRPAPTEFRPYWVHPLGTVEIIDPFGSPTFATTTVQIDAGHFWYVPTKIPILPDLLNVPPASTAWRTVGTSRVSQSVSDSFESRGWGRGKPCFADPVAKVAKRGGLVRFSDPIVPSANLNGINMFAFLNAHTVQNDLGDIRSLVNVRNEIIGVCTNGPFAIYSGVEQPSMDPDSYIRIQGGVLGQFRPFMERLGTSDPRSVVRGTDFVAWFCRQTGSIALWQGNALQDMSAKRRAKAYSLRKARNSQAGSVVTGFDMQNGEAWFSFPPITYDDGTNTVEEDGESLSLHVDRGFFIARHRHYPDAWANAATFTFSFIGGKLIAHERDRQNLNNINGTVVTTSIDIPIAAGGAVAMTPDAAWLADGRGWKGFVADDMGSVAPLWQPLLDVGNVLKYKVGQSESGATSGDIVNGLVTVVKLAHDGQSRAKLHRVRLMFKLQMDT